MFRFLNCLQKSEMFQINQVIFYPNCYLVMDKPVSHLYVTMIISLRLYVCDKLMNRQIALFYISKFDLHVYVYSAGSKLAAEELMKLTDVSLVLYWASSSVN